MTNAKAHSALLLLCLSLGVAGFACSSADPSPSSTFPSDESTTLPSTSKSEKLDEPATPPSIASKADSAPCTIGVRTAEGCEVTYDIAGDAAEGIGTECVRSPNLYNDCTSDPFAFHWTDASDKAPKSVRVEMQTSVFCPAEAPSSAKQSVMFNDASKPIGSFEGDLASCSCFAAGETRSFELSPATVAAYHVGGDNVVAIAGENRCFGMQKNEQWGGAIARVTVAY